MAVAGPEGEGVAARTERAGVAGEHELPASGAGWNGDAGRVGDARARHTGAEVVPVDRELDRAGDEPGRALLRDDLVLVPVGGDGLSHLVADNQLNLSRPALRASLPGWALR